MCKYGYKTENARFGMRAAIAKQVRGDAALRTVPLFRISVGFGAGRVLVRGAQRRACIKTVTYFYGYSIIDYSVFTYSHFRQII